MTNNSNVQIDRVILTLDIEELCEILHDEYEAAALQEGWQTQEQSREPWADVPEPNKNTMRIALRQMFLRLGKGIGVEVMFE